MTAIVIENFGGIAPRFDPKRLADNLAVTASNVVLSSGGIEALPGKTNQATVFAAGNYKSLYFHVTDRQTQTGTWLTSTTDRHYAPVPIANDTKARIIWTQAGSYPRVRDNGGNEYRVGLPAPTPAPNISGWTAPSDPNDPEAESIAYVMTYVDSYGSEGPPSSTSIIVTRVPNTNVTLSSLPIAPSGAYNFSGTPYPAYKRLYRTNTGSQGTQFQLVPVDIPIATTTFTDTYPNDQLGEVLPSFSWTGPPDETSAWIEPMQQIVALPNGVLAGYSDRTVVFNEPYLYHAWPVEYQITLENKIMGIAPVTGGLLVTTTDRPYLVTGVHPSAMALIPLDCDWPCVSRRSVVGMGEFAIYATTVGLVMVSGTTAKLITEQAFDKAAWDSYFPSTIHAQRWHGRYVAFYNGGSNATRRGFIFDPLGGTNAFTTLGRFAEFSYSAFYDTVTDELYVVSIGTNDGQPVGTLQTFGTDEVNRVPYTWKSKKFVMPKPVSFGAVRIETEEALSASPITFKVWADDALKATITLDDTVSAQDVTDGKNFAGFFRLPSGFRAKVWQFEIAGTNRVSYLAVAESPEELV